MNCRWTRIGRTSIKPHSGLVSLSLALTWDACRREQGFFLVVTSYFLLTLLFLLETFLVVLWQKLQNLFEFSDSVMKDDICSEDAQVIHELSLLFGQGLDKHGPSHKQVDMALRGWEPYQGVNKCWLYVSLEYSLQWVYIQSQYCESGMLKVSSNDLRETSKPSMNSFTIGPDDKRKNGHSPSSTISTYKFLQKVWIYIKWILVILPLLLRNSDLNRLY